jgi:hypothetical protein
MGLADDYYGGYQPTPSMNLPGGNSGAPLSAEVRTVYGLGRKLREENATLRPRLDAIRGNFKMDENNYRSAAFPMARGLANVSPMVQTAMYTMDVAVWSAGWTLQSHVEGNKALGNISMKIATEFANVDQLNAAGVDRVREVTGIYPAPPPDPRIERMKDYG